MNEIYTIDMFVVGDEIYKMKYFGNDLRADKSKSYVIIEIVSINKNPHMGVPIKNTTRMGVPSPLVVYLDDNTRFIIEDCGTIYGEKLIGKSCLCM